jgi:DNA-binding NarL/FixJ family response regulator
MKRAAGSQKPALPPLVRGQRVAFARNSFAGPGICFRYLQDGEDTMIKRQNESEMQEGFDKRVWDLHRQGKSNHQIADQLDSTVDEVAKSITRLADDPPR